MNYAVHTHSLIRDADIATITITITITITTTTPTLAVNKILCE
jgi:hypothetical protein